MTDQNALVPPVLPPGRAAVQRFEAEGQVVEIGIQPHHKPKRDMTLEAWICAANNWQWSGIVSRIYDTGSTENWLPAGGAASFW